MKKQKKEIFKPIQLEIVAFDTEDIVTTSGNPDGSSEFIPGENEGPFVPAEKSFYS